MIEPQLSSSAPRPPSQPLRPCPVLLTSQPGAKDWDENIFAPFSTEKTWLLRFEER